MNRVAEVEDRLSEFIEAERPALVRLAARILRNSHEAEDVVQDTLARVWARSDRSSIASIEAYAARAVWINALKRRARRGPSPQRKVSELEAPASEESVLGPWELEQALRGLPETQQAVIRLKYYAGMSFRQIGKALSVSMNTAASRCRYGLEALRKAFRRSP